MLWFDLRTPYGTKPITEYVPADESTTDGEERLVDIISALIAKAMTAMFGAAN